MPRRHARLGRRSLRRPRDPGGRTNRGVTQRTYDAWRAARGQPHADVYAIAETEVEAIYRGAYWDRAGCGALPAGSAGTAGGDRGGGRLSRANPRPARHGAADQRRIGLAVYAITLTAADCQERTLDLDAPGLADGFHAGERAEGLHYRWSAGDIVLPASLTAGLSGPLLLGLRFEPSTLRGWREPAHRPQKPTLRVVG